MEIPEGRADPQWTTSEASIITRGVGQFPLEHTLWNQSAKQPYHSTHFTLFFRYTEKAFMGYCLKSCFSFRLMPEILRLQLGSLRVVWWKKRYLWKGLTFLVQFLQNFAKDCLWVLTGAVSTWEPWAFQNDDGEVLGRGWGPEHMWQHLCLILPPQPHIETMQIVFSVLETSD